MRLAPSRLSAIVTGLAFGVAVGVLASRASAQQAWTSMSEGGVATHLGRPGPLLPDPLRHVPDEVLVRLKPGLPPGAAARALASVRTRSVRAFRSLDRLYHLRLAPGESLGRVLRTLAQHADVQYAEPNFVIEAFATPDDPSFPSQWALDNTGQTGGTPGADIDAASAWEVTTGSPGVVVAVIDTGVDYTHPDLAANMYRNPADCDGDGIDGDANGFVDDCYGIDTVNGDADPMDDETPGHGTHVAGIIGAAGNNLTGVAGVNWRVGILACKFLDSSGSGTTAGAIGCLDYVALMRDRGVNIVATNNSWGGGLFSHALNDAIASHQARGILFVAAAGNAGRDNDTVLTYPCAYYVPNVVCVAATNHFDLRDSLSNYGRGTVHLGAPGVSILSTLRGNTYGTLSGTSMAAPHVTGVVALLAAQDPARGWAALKNLVLAGAEPRASLADTITGGRLSALGSLACTGAAATSRVRPLGAYVSAGIGARVELAALNVVCDAPAGNVAVTVRQTGEVVTLLDDGAGGDQVAGDGLYTGVWTPAGAGAFDLAFPDGTTVRVDVDPHLKPGFPVKAFAGSGSYQAGPAVHTLVGNIDGDEALEILVTGLAQGPLFAWNADGTAVPGWPALDTQGASYPGLAEMAAGPGLEVFAGHFAIQAWLAARTGSGAALPGWPRRSANFVASPPSAADLDGDGLDEVLVEEQDWELHAYRSDGTPVAGWPASDVWGGQERHTAAIADLDGDGDLEIVTASGWTSSVGVLLYAYHHDGTPVAGFPVSFDGSANTFPAVGDVDGDGAPEIVVANRSQVLVIGAGGALERSMAASGIVPYGTAPALADLDGDGVPEIVRQSDTTVDVWKGDGTVLPGWPVQLGVWTWLDNAAPVVGDIDGDGAPEVVVLALDLNNTVGDVLAFRADGTLHPAFPKRLTGLGSGAVPAIADIDLDGRNDLVVTSDFWNGVPGYYDKVWVYDLGGPAHGPILWGQFMASAKHDGRYAGPVAPIGVDLLVTPGGGGSGVVTSSPPGIDCGPTCSASYAPGTTVTLTATAAAGSVFVSWGGACAGQGNPCQVAMNADLSVTVTFEPAVTLTVTLEGPAAGTVTSSPTGIACGTDCSEVYARGTVVTLTATPATGGRFHRWGGACSGEATTRCVVTMDAARSVTARFLP